MRRIKIYQAFTLAELALVLVLTSLTAAFALKVLDNTPKRNANCVVETRQKVQVVRGAIEQFARKNSRLPRPAPRNVGSDSPKYGQEAVFVSSGTNPRTQYPDIDIYRGGSDVASQSAIITKVSYGAVPWQALGLTSDYAGDCWGNKLSYVVNYSLTKDTGAAAFQDQLVQGSITLMKDASTVASTKIAYAVFSHGEDELGAVKLNYSKANTGSADPNIAHGWCTGTGLAKANCLGTGSTLMDTTYNNGKDAGANYFDDIILASGKPPSMTPPGYYMYGWGSNSARTLTDVWGPNSDGFTLPIELYQTGALVADPLQTLYTNFNNTCGITGTGKAYCWGDNYKGQLGDGTQSMHERLTPVNTTLSFTALAVGQYHVCGLEAGTGAAYCWGDNTYGQLGTGTTSTTPTLGPVAVNTTHRFNSITAGQNHTCAIKQTTNEVFCWGHNHVGQVGANNGATYVSSPAQVVNYNSSTSVTTNIIAHQVASESNHTCGLNTSTHVISCWGINSKGERGDNTSGQTFLIYATNTLLSGLNSGEYFTSIATGGGGNKYTFSSIPFVEYPYGHTCGTTNMNRMFCWGSRWSLGGGACLPAGSHCYYNVPTLLNNNFAFTSVTVGEDFSCGLAVDGTAYCWGDNHAAQLGSGLGSVGLNSPQYAVGNGLTFSSIVLGTAHACGKHSSSNKFYCWGLSKYGQTGNAKTVFNNSPVASVTRGLSFAKGSHGGGTACGITTDGMAYCWGRNSNNQLGNPDWSATGGTTVPAPTPLSVTGGHSFVDIGVANGHACAVDGDGQAWCWGDNDNGRLGDNSATTADTHTPVAVTMPTGVAFKSIFAGDGRSCALDETGNAYCWGLNDTGQLGVGNTVNRDVPTLIPGFQFKTLLLGSTHSCGLTKAASDNLYCWGENGNKGLLGYGGSSAGSYEIAPRKATGNHTFDSISASGYHTCGLKKTAGADNGEIWCWGRNSSGQLGMGSTSWAIASPTKVLNSGTGVGKQTYKSVGAFGGNTCALETSGTPWCWGSNDGGQLGNGSMEYPNSTYPPHPTPAQVIGTRTFDLLVGNSAIGGNSLQWVAGISGDSPSILALVQTPSSVCSDLSGVGFVPDGTTVKMYQSPAPTGSCQFEWRTCSGGVWTGSYAHAKCHSGCDARTFSWRVGNNTCSGTMNAMAYRANQTINATTGVGSANVHCGTGGPDCDTYSGVGGSCNTGGVLQFQPGGPVPTCTP